MNSPVLRFYKNIALSFIYETRYITSNFIDFFHRENGDLTYERRIAISLVLCTTREFKRRFSDKYLNRKEFSSGRSSLLSCHNSASSKFYYMSTTFVTTSHWSFPKIDTIVVWQNILLFIAGPKGGRKGRKKKWQCPESLIIILWELIVCFWSFYQKN